MKRFRIACLLLAAAAMAAPPPVAAAEQPAPPPAAAVEKPAQPQADAPTEAASAEPSAGPAAGELPLLDETRVLIHDGFEWLVRGVDRLFGDQPFERGGRVAGRIRLGTLWRQDDGFDWLTRFAIRARLPNLEARGTYFFLGRDNEREVVSDRPDGLTRREALLPEAREDQSFFAGLGRDLRRGFSYRVGLRGGLKPFAQARYRQQWDLGTRSQVEFRETVFWTLDDRFGSTTALNFDHLLDPTLALRWQNAGTISQESDGLEWSSSIGLYYSPGFQRQLSLEALINGATERDTDVSEYGVRLRWEQPIYKDWLLLETIVGYFWPRRGSEIERDRAFALGFSLQLLF